ncbi:1484_t:CDS:2, partial [Dentiscutata heterogama]
DYIVHHSFVKELSKKNNNSEIAIPHIYVRLLNFIEQLLGSSLWDDITKNIMAPDELISSFILPARKIISNIFNPSSVSAINSVGNFTGQKAEISAKFIYFFGQKGQTNMSWPIKLITLIINEEHFAEISWID